MATPDISDLLISEFSSLTSDTELDTFRDLVDETISRSILSLEDFKSFMDNLCEKQDTIRFWYQFISVDIMAYIGLYISICYRNWQLRNISIKHLAAIFTAFDRPVYQRLVPAHIHDILTLPSPILHHLERGSFSVRLTATEWHGIALDKCHEMKIYKDAKMAGVCPSETKMEYLAHYLPFQANSVNNFHQQLFPERAQHTLKFSKKAAINVERMLKAIYN